MFRQLGFSLKPLNHPPAILSMFPGYCLLRRHVLLLVSVLAAAAVVTGLYLDCCTNGSVYIAVGPSHAC